METVYKPTSQQYFTLHFKRRCCDAADLRVKEPGAGGDFDWGSGMCELFAANARTPIVLNDLLREFYSHSVLHPDGWGLGWREEDGEACLVKEPVTANDSEMLADMLARPVEATHLIAHIRKATHGAVALYNCHPFTETDLSGHSWIMAHNGVMINESLLAGYEKREKGQTDSERVMLFLLDVLDEAFLRKGAALTFDERFVTLAQAIDQLSNGNKLNVILDDGEYLYVHSNTVEGTLFYRQENGAALVSTSPLDDAPWELIPVCRLVAFKDGKIERTSHRNSRGFTDSILPYLHFAVSARSTQHPEARAAG